MATRVRILTPISDHVRVYTSGEVCDLPDDQAERWVAAGLAEPAGRAELGVPETTTAPHADAEHATQSRARSRG